MNELIKVNYETEYPSVLGRELHGFLEVSTEYAKWFERMCEYGFTEGTDFSSFLTESTGGRPATDHLLTIDMGKELCMLQRNERGKQARQYFIQVEKAWNDPEMIMTRALKLAENRIKALQTNNTRLEAEKETLQIELDTSKQWLTVKRVSQLNNLDWREISWKRLKQASIAMNKEIRKIFDPNFSSVNLYHIDVFRAVYPELRYGGEQ